MIAISLMIWLVLSVVGFMANLAIWAADELDRLDSVKDSYSRKVTIKLLITVFWPLGLLYGVAKWIFDK